MIIYKYIYTHIHTHKKVVSFVLFVISILNRKKENKQITIKILIYLRATVRNYYLLFKKKKIELIPR
jgi:hypothetical protein